MVNKKVSNNISNQSEKLEKNLHNLNVDENYKKEALDLYKAIHEGQIDLNPKEKKEILKELDLILNHFDASSNDQFYNPNIVEDNVEKNSNQINNPIMDEIPESSYDKLDNKLDEDISSNLIIEKLPEETKNIGESSADEVSIDDVDKDLSVDGALNDLMDVNSSEEIIDDENSLKTLVNIETSNTQSIMSVDNDIGGSLSVDDALGDLIENYSDEVAIKVENVSMEFKISKDKIDTLKEYFIRTVKRNKSDTKILTALKDISFEIPKGDRVGIIGFNGAGKSTLLKVLSGVYDATEGTIETKGKIAPLLELGAGFDYNYSGKDNIFLNGAFLGYTEDFLKEKYDEIVEFSELGDAINYHVKTYSSGMRAKLGFAIATIVEPDILILDEILSVGDIRFRKKSADKIRSLINSGITVLLVSHSVAQIRDLCNKAIWIDEGKLKMYGEVNEVCDAYVKAANDATKEQLTNITLD